MTHDADLNAAVEREFERLRLNKQRRDERLSGNLGMVPGIKMRVGEWYVDELGVLTREITARD